jgi:SAM-dependent methyltransferase
MTRTMHSCAVTVPITDNSAWHAHVRALLCADIAAPADVVEFGAAPGDQIAALARLGYRATALELGVASDEWGAHGEGGMAKLFEDTGVRGVQWDLEVTPYPLDDSAFDAVVMTEVFEHLREYPIESLREARRVLRPGGRLYFTTPNAVYLKNRVRLLLGRSVATPLPDWIDGLPHARHAREYTFAEVRELMALAGLRIVREQSRHFYEGTGGRFARAGKRIVGTLARLRPSLGPAIIVVAERPSAAPRLMGR